MENAPKVDSETLDFQALISHIASLIRIAAPTHVTSVSINVSPEAHSVSVDVVLPTDAERAREPMRNIRGVFIHDDMKQDDEAAIEELNKRLSFDDEKD